MLSGWFGPELEITKNKDVVISGINWYLFEKDLVRLYGTTTMTKYMFKRLNSRRFKTKEFFLLELNHLINKLLQLKSTRTSRKDLVKLSQLLLQETWIANTVVPAKTTFDYKQMQKKVKLKPFDTQLGFLTSYSSRKATYNLSGLLLDGKVGSGKTFLSLAWSTSLGEGKTVIVSPLNVVDEVWSNHLSNNIKHEVWHTPPKFWTSKMIRPPEASDEFYVIHYEFLTNPLCEKYMRLIKSFNGRNSDFKLIVDECHNFNDPSAKRTKELIRYHKELGFTDSLPMSGTPLKGLGKEAYCVFCLIAPDFEGVVRDQFLDTYGRARDRLNELLSHRIGVKKYTINALQGMDDAPEPTRVKVKVPNADRFTLRAVRAEMAVYIKDRFKYYKENMDMYLDYFNETISDYRSAMTRAGDEKALADLETYLTIVNKFRRDGYNNFTDSDLSKQAKLIELDIEAWMKPTDRKYFRSAKSVVKYVGLKIQGEALGNVLGTARIEAVKALVEYADLPSYIDHVEKKTLVFTDHVDVVHETEDYLTRVGYKPQVVYGGNGKDRDKLVAEAEKNPEINPLITTFEMLGTGFPLVFANQVLCMNPPWRSHILTQTIARVHRQGQTAKQTFAYIFELDTGTEENVTSRTVDIMQWSKEQVEVLMGSTFGMDVEMVGVAGNEDLFSEEELAITFSSIPRKESSLFDLF